MKQAVWMLPLMLGLAGSAIAADTHEAANKAARSSLGAGYLNPEMVPDSVAILPFPPAEGSAAMARDEEASKAALAQRGTSRADMAVADAELMNPSSTSAMACAAGFTIGEKETPAIQRLLRRVTADLGMSGAAAKKKYARPRPFMINGEPSCTPDWEPLLRKDGSYPSGHSAIGYGWGLIMAEIVPDRAAALVSRGIAFGDSRRFCNVHWASDVEAGRITASAMVARLHANSAFLKDMKAAKAEARKAHTAPSGSTCAAEATALTPTLTNSREKE